MELTRENRPVQSSPLSFLPRQPLCAHLKRPHIPLGGSGETPPGLGSCMWQTWQMWGIRDPFSLAEQGATAGKGQLGHISRACCRAESRSASQKWSEEMLDNRTRIFLGWLCCIFNNAVLCIQNSRTCLRRWQSLENLQSPGGKMGGGSPLHGHDGGQGPC